MEQQKILWVIFSVALFILVIVGVGVIWFLPANHAQTPQATTAQSGTQSKISFDPYEWAQTQNNSYPGLSKAPSTGSSSEQGQSQGQSSGNFTIIYGQQPEQSSGSSQQSAVTVAPPPKEPAPVQTGGVATAVAPAPKAAAPRTVAPKHTVAVAKPAPAQRAAPAVQHWIQVASYTSSYRAEQAKKLLEHKGISGKILSHDINGTTYFRVRVGPYPSKQQAEQLLSEIKKNTIFHSSFVVLVYAS